MNTPRISLSPVNKTPQSNILRRTLTRTNSNSSLPSKIPVTNPEVHKWKHKYEESEQKRKTLLSDKEKASRQLNDVEKKYVDLLEKHEILETELFEQNEKFSRLSLASKNLYKEYETLKNQYEIETGAMSKALKDASQWYKENKALKRKTLLLERDTDTVDEGVDTGESTPDSDIDNLNKTIKQLSTEVAELQTEVDSLKQTEFQTSEQNIRLTEELETEKATSNRLREELQMVRNENEQLIRISEMMKQDLQQLRESEENQRNNADSLRKEAVNYRKERNVLKHQSNILLQGFSIDSEENYMKLFQEIEELQRTLEDERNKHEEEVNALQEKLEEQENNSQIEIVEERLKLAENELEIALLKANRAEAAEAKINALESQLKEALERAQKAEKALIPPAPPLPPPPPPPVANPTDRPVVPLRVKRRSKVNVLELAETIGVEANENKKPVPAVGVNEDIIKAIKEGQFTLKKAKNNAAKKEKEHPKAVSEFLNILGSLRRAPKKRQSLIGSTVQV